ncbi:MAG: hypothetical protein HOW73_25580 [Polyangiaceae bacterium]|nr:hypothetical protein [Polyangiaceae bacterium]
MYPHDAPVAVVFGILGLSIAALITFVIGIRRAAQVEGASAGIVRRRTIFAAIGATAWAAAFGVAAASGVLRRVDVVPPPMAPMLVVILGSAIALGLSRVGGSLARNIPLAVLIGVQAFRLPLELVMHEAANAGVMPVQLSFSGLNFDIVTGTTAIVLAPLVAMGRAPKELVIAWNVYGLAMLTIIAGIAVATAPFVRAFGDGSVNTWITYVPFVWLPAVLVPFALAGHIVVLRSLAFQTRPHAAPAIRGSIRSAA